MEGWKDGRMEGWKVGRMEGWKDGRMEDWKVGRMEDWKDGRMGDLWEFRELVVLSFTYQVKSFNIFWQKYVVFSKRIKEGLNYESPGIKE